MGADPTVTEPDSSANPSSVESTSDPTATISPGLGTVFFTILSSERKLFDSKDNFFYRICIHDAKNTIKYLALPQDLSPGLADPAGVLLDFAVVPASDWNIAQLVIKDNSDQNLGNTLAISDLLNFKLGDVDKWHKKKVDWHTLKHKSDGMKLLQCQKTAPRSLVTQTRAHGEKHIVHYDWSPIDNLYMRRLSNIYKLIDGKGIGPRCVAHVTENKQRIIGLMVEHVEGRCPKLVDLPACKAVLQKLHDIGYVYGGKIGYDTFIIQNDNTAIIHDLGSVRPSTHEPVTLLAEMDVLSQDMTQQGASQSANAQSSNSMFKKLEDSVTDAIAKHGDRFLRWGIPMEGIEEARIHGGLAMTVKCGLPGVLMHRCEALLDVQHIG
ncbi:hypothetical protein S7711_07544 [Stachybotrys chartarum IBT 7711]|uniref:Uncharacterized protein n=1 Tax=Stachybotrys chartarum (strain CBS 109288 / IBT 7711) TaxID=1280523 RepID=A0A084AN79_STACB|nr:hypothetical protein S7711_07544 [Stachybotrys chartarum IBT 7711]